MTREVNESRGREAGLQKANSLSKQHRWSGSYFVIVGCRRLRQYNVIPAAAAAADGGFVGRQSPKWETDLYQWMVMWIGSHVNVGGTTNYSVETMSAHHELNINVSLFFILC